VQNVLVRNATGTLVNFFGRERLVTMKHVLDAYRAKKAEDPRTVFAFGGLEFDPIAIVVAESEKSDLAVLDTSGARFSRDAPHLPTLSYFTPTTWPPGEVAIGDKVFLGGWPESYRQVRDEGREVFSKPESLVGIVVTDLQTDHFVCTLDRSNWSQSREGDPAYLNEPSGSGFSGSPVFSRRRDERHLRRRTRRVLQGRLARVGYAHGQLRASHRRGWNNPDISSARTKNVEIVEHRRRHGFRQGVPRSSVTMDDSAIEPARRIFAPNARQ
jgi:hypothetical protein